MLRQGLGLALIMLIVIWLYESFVPPPPKICGTPGGPPVTGPRILLRDGRHLSYKEYGVPKHIAKFKIIFLHGHTSNKKDTFLASQGLFAEFQVYIVGFDRPGYGESDPDSKRTVKSTILDVEELVDHLELGQKVHVMGYSAGGFYVWGCLKYIPHRLEGAILIAPGVNFWWPQLPSSLVEEAFHQQRSWSQWNCLIAHYSPWLMYWWNTQNSFEPKMSKYMNKFDHYYSYRLAELDPDEENLLDYSTQQGLYESYLRDEIISFGEWEFEPLDLEDAFVGDESLVVHLWQGGNDSVVPVVLQRYIVERLSWVHYHEVPNGGHKFAMDDTIKHQIFKTLVVNEPIVSA